MRNILYIRISSPIRNLSAQITTYLNDVDVRYLVSISLWISDSQLHGIEDGKRGTTAAGAVGVMVVEMFKCDM